MPRIYLEDFVRPDHLNGDGTVKYNVNTAYAANAFGAAMRKGQIQGIAGVGGGVGPFGWPPMYGGLKSAMYLWEEPVDWTVITASIIESMSGSSMIYYGDNFRPAGKYNVDEYGLKSIYEETPFRSGVPDPTGATVPYSLAPQIDMSGSAGNTIRGLNFYGQKAVGSALPMQPSHVAGAGVLVTGLERTVSDGLGGWTWDGTGGSGGSNNNTFDGCNWLGFWRGSGLILQNAILTILRNGGISIWYNSSASRALVSSQLPVNIGSVEPLPVGANSVQSAFYPNPSNLRQNDQRYLCSQSATGALVLDNFEIHSLVADTFPTGGQSNIAAPILLHKTRQFTVRNRVLGHDGMLAMIEVFKYGSHFTFDGVEFWNVDRRNEALQRGVLWLNDCRYPNVGESPGEYAPLIGLTFTNCVLNGSYVPGSAYIRGGSGSAIRNLDFGPSNEIRGDVAIMELNRNWPDPNRSFLDYATIYCKGSPIYIGGSLNNTVRLADPGPISLSSGGIDNSRKF